MNEAIRTEERLKRAYELAYFIHNNKEIARRIAIEALSKLEVAANAQYKRLYYTPTGRAESSRASRSKVYLNDTQLLQRLVYVESEQYEKRKEETKTLNEDDLLIHFIKHLVRITLKRNSFYVTLGLSRILHSYRTGETMEIYNTVIQDPERVHDDYYYRSRKGQLMKELKTRFGDLLSIARGVRGEERFNARESAEEKSVVVKSSLNRFTPWATHCVVPDDFDPLSDSITHLSFDGQDPDEEQRIEVNRIHSALHPNCYCKIIKALRFESPYDRLEIPKFAMNEYEDTEPPNDRTKPPALDDNEIQAIKELLATASANRRGASCSLLRVLIDGEEYARLNPNEAGKVNFDLNEEAEVIEVRIVEKGSDVLLATNLLSFDDAEQKDAEIVLEGGQKISFNLTPTKDEYGEITGARCGIAYEETGFLRRKALAWRRFMFAVSSSSANVFWKPALAFGLLLLICALGFYLFLRTGKQDEVVKHKEIPTPAPTVEVITPTPAPSVEPSPAKQEKEPQKKESKPIQRKEPAPPVSQKEETANNNQKQPSVSPNQEALIVKRTPIYNRQKPERDTQNDTRNENTNLGNLSLKDIQNLYVEVDGDETLGKEFQELFGRDLQRNNRFVISQDREQADGRLKISVRSNSDNNTVTAVVFLSNGRGFVVWPSRARVVSWKYVGKMENISLRIVNDLVNDANKAK